MRYARYIGIPFAYGGRGPDAYDCYGLVMALYSRFHGVTLPDEPVVADAARNALHVHHTLKRKWRPVDPQPGSVLVLRVNSVGAHVGFQIDDFRFIHAWEHSHGVTIEPINRWSEQNAVYGHYLYAGPDVA